MSQQLNRLVYPHLILLLIHIVLILALYDVMLFRIVFYIHISFRLLHILFLTIVICRVFPTRVLPATTQPILSILHRLNLLLTIPIIIHYQQLHTYQAVLSIVYISLHLIYYLYRPISVNKYTGARVTIMSMNMQSGDNLYGQYDLQDTARVITQSGADIIALQEIDIHCERDCYGKPLPAERTADDQPARLLELTPYEYIEFAAKTQEFGGEYGIAILSRYPILDTKSIILDSWKLHGSNVLYGSLQQTALAVLVEVPDFREPVWVVCAHLGCDLSGIEQLFEFEEIEERIVHELEGHIFICGDYNSPASTPVIQFASQLGYSDAWRTAATRRQQSPCWIRFSPFYGGTRPANLPLTRLDYIMYKSKGSSLYCESCEVISTHTSDHLPLKAVFIEPE